MATGSAAAADTAGGRPVRGRGRARVWGAVAWAVVAPFAVWAVLRLLPADVQFHWVQIVAFTPYVALASLVAPLVALAARRRTPFAAAVCVTTVLATCVVPRALGSGQPAADGPALRVMSANLLMGSVPAADLVGLVRREHPDVLTLQEFTPAAEEAYRRAGLGTLLPYAVSSPRQGVGGSAVFARFPLDAGEALEYGGFRQATATVRVPGAGPVGIVSVHPCAPRYVERLRCWRDGLAALPRPGRGVRILSGDFNATLDHARVRDLLAAGYRDAADATGDGLSTTWPYRPWRLLGVQVPPVTIDHVLVDPRVAVRSFAVNRLPRTDHRSIVADLVLPRG
ncbi:endonuclease/exonuclease/phosphatase family protein [Microbispora sp. ATCC PTA-5024]|uniref:endonuclease/exonuclease/phosphatase family protein n=1 Tax=Microbispora sp. ATCC PTA-5024 TaxID=316330 RepID=UPI0003DD7A99|nr:endonuclease/exonuclease/phosphatase family protein [Microbispora sp. ATCC PTA-5024]ETK36073.1 endonuclease [Microbispora sp. ATCC PTA-5024]